MSPINLTPTNQQFIRATMTKVQRLQESAQLIQGTLVDFLNALVAEAGHPIDGWTLSPDFTQLLPPDVPNESN